MKTVSHRARTAVIAVLAAVAMAVVPAVAANAEGPGSATITFAGAQLPAFEYVWYQGPDGEFEAAPVDSDGVLQLTDLALGDYSASLSATATTQGVSFSFTLTAEAPHYEAEIELLPWPTGTASITGVVSGSGSPLESVTVYLNSMTGQSFPEATTGPDGAFSFTDLAAGTYELYFYVEGPFFSKTIQVELADDEAANLDVVLTAQDSAITGRVVDPGGAGVEGVAVAAFNGSDGGFAVTDVDGYYTIAGLGAGEWTVSLGGPDHPWEYTSTVVILEADSTATAPDLVAIALTTGSINGLVLASDLPAEEAGLAGVCADVVTPNGMPVEGASAVTEFAGNYFIDEIPPGEYTIAFTDCDDTRVPGYLSAYLGDTANLEDAATFSISAADNLWVGYVHLVPDDSPPQPSADPQAARARDLTEETRDLVDGPSVIGVGQNFEIEVGEEYAGQWVSVWLRTPTTLLGGWRLVAADGTLMIVSPERFPPAEHRLVVQDANDEVIGWTTVRVERPNDPGTP